MLRIAHDHPDFEDEWDPQGLNSLNKDELESFSDDEEENESEEALKAAWDVNEDENEEEESHDLDRDGLTELEEMERNLLQEQSILDFAMVGDEE